MNVSTKWWMWVLMPIGSLIGAFALAMGVAALQWISTIISGNGTNGWGFVYMLPIITSAVWGIAYSIIAYKLSPHSKFIASTVMITILAVVFILAEAYAWFFPAGMPIGELIFSTIKVIISIAGAIGGLHYIHSEENFTKNCRI